MKIKELLEKVQKVYDKNPDTEVGIWIWENYGKSPNYDNCLAENAEIVEIFDGAFVISCDMKGHKKK